MSRKSSESHQVHLNGRVVFEVDEVTKISPFHLINIYVVNHLGRTAFARCDDIGKATQALHRNKSSKILQKYNRKVV